MTPVWKEISLPNNHTLSTTGAASSSAPSSLRFTILQDFLSRPSSSPPRPATLLTLTSGGPAFDFHDEDPQHSPTAHLHRHHPGPFDALASSFISSFGNKRLAEEANDTAPSDRRHKRMMMNRESAARSRARKQAYINELELKNTRLMAENAELKLKITQQMEQQAEPAVHQTPHKKHTLQRTWTAPF